MAEVTEQIIREAPEIEALKVGLIKSAQTLSQKPLEIPAYQAAGLSGLQQQAIGLAGQGIGAYAPFVQAGQGAMEAGIGALGQSYGAPTVADLQTYMNPYQQMVTEQSLRELRRQGDIAQQQAAAQAVRSGAFGGTREGVQRAELERNLNDVMARQIFQDYAQNYAQAQGLFGNQQQRALQAGQALGIAGLQQAQLGEAAQKMGLQDISTLATLGQTQQQAEQARLEAARATGLQQAMTPYQQLSFLSDIYKGAPGTQMALTAGTAPTTSPLLQAAGLGISGLAAATGAAKAGLF